MRPVGTDYDSFQNDRQLSKCMKPGKSPGDEIHAMEGCM